MTAASREALMSEWREVVGRPPPKHLSLPLLVQILNHAYQLDTVGGGVRTMRTSLRFDLKPALSLQAAAATQLEQRHGSA